MSLDTNLQSAFSAVAGAIKQRVPASEKGQPLGVATLGSDGKVPSAQLPSYVDDAIEAATLADFPIIGEASKIYIAIDTGREYRWGGTVYAQIANSGQVDSVNGKTGVVVLTKEDVNLANVDSTADINKAVATAGKFTHPVAINGVDFDGSADITITTVATPLVGDVSTKICTTAFVATAVGALSTTIGATDTDLVAVFNAAMV